RRRTIGGPGLGRVPRRELERERHRRGVLPNGARATAECASAAGALWRADVRRGARLRDLHRLRTGTGVQHRALAEVHGHLVVLVAVDEWARAIRDDAAEQRA